MSISCNQELLDALIAATNLLEKKPILKSYFASWSPFHKLKPTNREELLAFIVLRISIELIIKNSMQALQNNKEWK